MRPRHQHEITTEAGRGRGLVASVRPGCAAPRVRSGLRNAPGMTAHLMLSIQPNPEISFKIRYQDDELLVVDKPPRQVTQPGKGHEDDTLLNGLFAQFGAEL